MTKSKSQKAIVYKTHDTLKGFATLDASSTKLAYSMGLPTNVNSAQFEQLQLELDASNISVYWVENYCKNYSY